MSATVTLSRRAAEVIAAAGQWLREHMHTVAARLRRTRRVERVDTVAPLALPHVVPDDEDDPDDDAAAFVARLRAERIAREEAGEPTPEQQVTAMLRSCGYKGRGFDGVTRAAFRELAELAYYRAEDDCRGALLNPEGERRGVNPRNLFMGTRAFAHKWASEELIWWWEQNGRLSYEEYVADLLHGAGAAVRADHAVMSA